MQRGGAQPTLRGSELVGRVDEMAGLLRDLAARGDAGASNEGIRAMRLGTTARSAFDSFLELNRIEDPSSSRIEGFVYIQCTSISLAL